MVFTFRAATPLDLQAAVFKSRLPPLFPPEMDSFPSVAFLLWLDLFKARDAVWTEDLPDPGELVAGFTAPPWVSGLLYGPGAASLAELRWKPMKVKLAG